jgi:hypothetical protein
MGSRTRQAYLEKIDKCWKWVVFWISLYMYYFIYRWLNPGLLAIVCSSHIARYVSSSPNPSLFTKDQYSD